eukprot:10027793-Alexandrium_andersonii.AAC.1
MAGRRPFACNELATQRSDALSRWPYGHAWIGDCPARATLAPLLLSSTVPFLGLLAPACNVWH